MTERPMSRALDSSTPSSASTTRIVIWSHWDDQTWEGDVDLAGLTVAEALERIFRQFNRVDDSDCARLLKLGYNLPSLSVGDIVTITDVRWRCASLGWELA